MADLIDRQAAIAEIKRWTGYIDEDMVYRIQTGLKKIPSAEPDVTDRNVGNLISREAMGDALNRIRVRKNETWYSFYQKALDELCKLPSAEPERKKGAWRHYEGYLYCSYCGQEFDDGIMEFFGDDVPRCCPECGADMRGDRNATD